MNRLRGILSTLDCIMFVISFTIHIKNLFHVLKVNLTLRFFSLNVALNAAQVIMIINNPFSEVL